jgi:hypothetical protein
MKRVFLLAVLLFKLFGFASTTPIFAEAELCKSGASYRNPENCCCAPTKTIVKTVTVAHQRYRRPSRGYAPRDSAIQRQDIAVQHLCAVCPSKPPVTWKDIWPSNAVPCCRVKTRTRTVTRTASSTSSSAGSTDVFPRPTSTSRISQSTSSKLTTSSTLSTSTESDGGPTDPFPPPPEPTQVRFMQTASNNQFEDPF